MTCIREETKANKQNWSKLQKYELMLPVMNN